MQSIKTAQAWAYQSILKAVLLQHPQRKLWAPFEEGSRVHLVLNESSEGQVIEEVRERLPNICISVFSEALIIKAIPAESKEGD